MCIRDSVLSDGRKRAYQCLSGRMGECMGLDAILERLGSDISRRPVSYTHLSVEQASDEGKF